MESKWGMGGRVQCGLEWVAGKCVCVCVGEGVVGKVRGRVSSWENVCVCVQGGGGEGGGSACLQFACNSRPIFRR